MEDGVIFRRSKKIGSRLIRWGTQENWSHCGVVINGAVYHSDVQGCRLSSIEEFCSGAETFLMPKTISEDQKNRAIQALGDKYDWGAIAWFALSVLLKRIWIILPKLTINPKWFVCSEYATYILWGQNETDTPGAVMDRVWDEQFKK
jgi:hypothetical protein